MRKTLYMIFFTLLLDIYVKIKKEELHMFDMINPIAKRPTPLAKQSRPKPQPPLQ